jgi:phospholipid/cholesterol/gamma-HCH transport system ATP-binding protein
MEPIVSVRNLVNAFGSQRVHNSVDVDVFPREIFGIVGGSGTGKSVLLRSMLGLHQPVAGDIHVLGKDMGRLDTLSKRFLNRHWGVMYQNGALFSGLTVLENVELPLREYLKLPDALITELAMLKLHIVGLSDSAAKKYPSELSGGMVKRAGLARALALDPSLVFLDEPTAGLDPIAADSFDALILELREKLGLTVIMITHDLDTLFRICDRAGVLIDGKMIQGKLDDLIRYPHPWVQQYFGGQRAQRARFPIQTPVTGTR